MDLFNNMFSQILGSFGGAMGGAGGAGSAIGQMAGAQGGNPFGDILGSLSNIIGGPASESGTLFSLPGELLTGVADLGTSENILKDTMGLMGPVGDLASSGLSSLGLSGLNPFGSSSGPMSEALRILGPIALIAGASALTDKSRRKR